MNMLSYVSNPHTKDSKFEFEMWYKHCYEALRLGDNLIDLEAEHIQRIIDKIESDPEPIEVKRDAIELWKKAKKVCLSGRRIGMGLTALGDTLAAMGLAYDSAEALALVDEIMRTKFEAELNATVDLSVLRGSFKGYDSTREYDTDNEGTNRFFETIKDEFSEAVERMRRYGRRNVSTSTVAPGGSISILTRTSSGIEPLFQPFYTRRKKINSNDANRRVDFVDDLGDKWQEFFVLHPQFKNWLLQNGEEPDDMTKEDLIKAYEKSSWYKSTANDIDWIKRVDMQSIITKYLTNACSSTINLPETVTYDEVSEIYMEAWKRGLKGVTIYREGSRSGVLVTDTSKKELFTFHDNHAPKRPKSLLCKVVKFNNNYEKWVAFVGLLDNKPYEVFTGKLENVNLPGTVEVGEITKIHGENGEKRYDFIYDGGVIEGISNISSKNYWNYGKLISGMLRHGMPLQYIVDTINHLNWDEEHINTWKAGIARALKKFIKDGEAIGVTCKDCGGTNVVFEEGCLSCKDCGSSKCG